MPSGRILVLAFLLLPLAALAAPSGPPVLDFTTGAPRELADRALGLARGFWVLSFIAALALEAFGRAPTAMRDYGACVFRGVVVLLLLAFYHPIFGSVVNLTQGIAERVTPHAAWSDFSHASHDYLFGLYDKRSAADQAAKDAGKGDPTLLDDVKLAGSIAGGFVFQSIISSIVLAGEALLGVVALFARILCGLFFVLGPLAIVFSIPRASDLGTRWFGHFVTFASWPIFSGLLLSLTLATGIKGLYAEGALGSVVIAFVFAGIGLATPMLASAVVGGSIKDVATHGAAMLKAKGFESAHMTQNVFESVRSRFAARTESTGGGDNGGSRKGQ
jgi:hypothetical protein